MSEEALKFDPRYKKKNAKTQTAANRGKAASATTAANNTKKSAQNDMTSSLMGKDTSISKPLVIPESVRNPSTLLAGNSATAVQSPSLLLNNFSNQSESGQLNLGNSSSIPPYNSLLPNLGPAGPAGAQSYSTSNVELSHKIQNQSQSVFKDKTSEKQQQQQQQQDLSGWDFDFRPSRHNFQSMAVNMEYSILSNILNTSMQPPYGIELPSGSQPGYSPSLSSTGGDSPSLAKQNIPDLYGTPQSTAQTSVQNSSLVHLNSLNQYALGLSNNGIVQNLPEVLETVNKLKQAQENSWIAGPDSPSGPKRPLSLTISVKPVTPHNTPTNPQNTPSNENSLDDSYNENSNTSYSSYFKQPYMNRMFDDGWLFRKYSEPADIYASVKQPYSYTPAYHQLTIYIRTRFSREQQLKIAKCMASYRPSFIACTNTLKEDDLIFMEQCFQRTLLEYEKFISYSGTPTLIWRRTGQVAAVGKEFCILTGWPRERLLNEQTFVVELMDDNSVLEYFEMFSKMAFGDSIGATMTECTLLTPQGQKIKTSSIWTLKRDVFGIPMMIVGNFLPILNQ